MIARNWGLPETFAKIVEQHARLDELLAASKMELGAVAVAVKPVVSLNGPKTWPPK